MECAKCFVSGDRARLLDFISPNGLVKLCKQCAAEEDFPVLKRKTESELREAEAKPSVYERLSRIAGIEKKREEKTFEEKKHEKERLEREEAKLKQIIDKNFQENIQARAIPTNHLIDNFNWMIMRSRRLKKMTQKELAQAIKEPEIAVKLAEQGIISLETPRLINKLEQHLQIQLEKRMGFPATDAETEVKPEIEVRLEPKAGITGRPGLDISFDPMTTRGLTIADLKVMREEREGEALKKSEEAEKKEGEKEEREAEEEKPLTDEEIDDILHGRK